MFTIHHAEQALRQGHQDEGSLRRYTVAILRELCVRRGIKVTVNEGERPLKRPYLEALLTHVR